MSRIAPTSLAPVFLVADKHLDEAILHAVVARSQPSLSAPPLITSQARVDLTELASRVLVCQPRDLFGQMTRLRNPISNPRFHFFSEALAAVSRARFAFLPFAASRSSTPTEWAE